MVEFGRVLVHLFVGHQRRVFIFLVWGWLVLIGAHQALVLVLIDSYLECVQEENDLNNQVERDELPLKEVIKLCPPRHPFHHWDYVHRLVVINICRS